MQLQSLSLPKKAWPDQQLKALMSIYQMFITIQNGQEVLVEQKVYIAMLKTREKFKLSRQQISNWLMKQNTYILHAPARRHFKRNRVIVGGIDKEWQLDLADVQSLM